MFTLCIKGALDTENADNTCYHEAMIRAFLYFIDQILPKPIRALPYAMAEIDLYSDLSSENSGFELWSRNSFKLGSFVFGISDLDLTIVTSGNLDHLRVKDFLKRKKKQWPFLGEANFYDRSDLINLAFFINKFEKQRDPELGRYLPEIIDESIEIEQLVFLLRLLQSDRELEFNPRYRHKKWIQHLAQLGITIGKTFNRSDLLDIICERIKNYPHLERGLRDWDVKRTRPDFDVYHADLDEGFKILYPHQHLWFHTDSFQSFFQERDQFEKKLIKRQIDWELWGLYTQRFYISRESMELHLSRLLKVYAFVAEETDILRVQSLLTTMDLNISAKS